MLADLQLPGVAGTELLARVRQLHPAARRALLVGWAMIPAWRRSPQATVLGDLDAYVVKPGTPPG